MMPSVSLSPLGLGPRWGDSGAFISFRLSVILILSVVMNAQGDAASALTTQRVRQ